MTEDIWTLDIIMSIIVLYIIILFNSRLAKSQRVIPNIHNSLLTIIFFIENIIVKFIKKIR